MSVCVSVVEFVRVITMGVGEGVPGKNVRGVGAPLGRLVGYDVGVWVDVAVGLGGVGVSVGVPVGVCASVGVAVGDGVRVGVELGVGVAVGEEVSGGSVTETAVGSGSDGA
jgi:hypothetical protein